MTPSDVPGYKIVEDKIKEINGEIAIIDVSYDFDRMLYKFKLSNKDRECAVVFSEDFLDDLNDFSGSKTSTYWQSMISELTSALIEKIERNGLIPYAKDTLKKLIFEHVKEELKNTDHINKFNLLGKPYQAGSLEYFLKVKFDDGERAQAGIAFDELKNQGILVPTYKDLISPEDWVKINEKGITQPVTETKEVKPPPVDDSKIVGNVRFPLKKYIIYHEGLKKLLTVIKERKEEARNLGLDDALFVKEIERVSLMIDYMEDKLKNTGHEVLISGVSVGSLRFLKAGALMEILHLEREKSRTSSPRIREAIENKISDIKNDINTTVFENIPPADCLEDVEDITSELSESPFKYDVVLSFAGEDREIVETLAILLRDSGYKVFYDRFEESKLWGKNLYDYLSDIYTNQGRYCVMFLSEHYAKKLWTTLERQSAQERAFKEHSEYILPVRIDDTKIPGILETVGYLDIREKNIEEIFGLLKEKLGKE